MGPSTVSAEAEDELLVFSPEAASGGLVAYWPFNGNANDESGNSNNGIVVGATLCPDEKGVASKAYCFDGVNDYFPSL